MYSQGSLVSHLLGHAHLGCCIFIAGTGLARWCTLGDMPFSFSSWHNRCNYNWNAQGWDWSLPPLLLGQEAVLLWAPCRLPLCYWDWLGDNGRVVFSLWHLLQISGFCRTELQEKCWVCVCVWNLVALPNKWSSLAFCETLISEYDCEPVEDGHVGRTELSPRSAGSAAVLTSTVLTVWENKGGLLRRLSFPWTFFFNQKESVREVNPWAKMV